MWAGSITPTRKPKMASLAFVAALQLGSRMRPSSGCPVYEQRKMPVLMSPRAKLKRRNELHPDELFAAPPQRTPDDTPATAGPNATEVGAHRPKTLQSRTPCATKEKANRNGETGHGPVKLKNRKAPATRDHPPKIPVTRTRQRPEEQRVRPLLTTC